MNEVAVKVLEEEHERLDKKIQDAYDHYAPDDDIRNLKEVKLALKRVIKRLQTTDY